MESIVIKNATIVGLQSEQIKMQSGDVRNKQSVMLTENGRDGVQLHGAEVWDDNIQKLNLQQGEQVDLSCRLVGRQWGGRFTYTLTAYKVERKQGGGADLPE